MSSVWFPYTPPGESVSDWARKMEWRSQFYYGFAPATFHPLMIQEPTDLIERLRNIREAIVLRDRAEVHRQRALQLVNICRKIMAPHQTWAAPRNYSKTITNPYRVERMLKEHKRVQRLLKLVQRHTARMKALRKRADRLSATMWTA